MRIVFSNKHYLNYNLELKIRYLKLWILKIDWFMNIIISNWEKYKMIETGMLN